jgi:hypothetical protein
MFENFNESQLELIYLGLKSLIESGSGEGFHNEHMEHQVYILGSRGEIDPSIANADSPEKNNLFKMLSELTKIIKERGIEFSQYEWWYDFSSWQNFCQFAINVYQKRRSEAES